MIRRLLPRSTAALLQYGAQLFIDCCGIVFAKGATLAHACELLGLSKHLRKNFVRNRTRETPTVAASARQLTLILLSAQWAAMWINWVHRCRLVAPFSGLIAR